MRWKSHVQCESGEKLEITSNSYLSISNDFNLTANEIIEHYNNQYDVERAFRISKTDLKIRPIYHRLETRIKAHILISFVSYAI